MYSFDMATRLLTPIPYHGSDRDGQALGYFYAIDCVSARPHLLVCKFVPTSEFVGKDLAV